MHYDFSPLFRLNTFHNSQFLNTESLYSNWVWYGRLVFPRRNYSCCWIILRICAASSSVNKISVGKRLIRVFAVGKLYVLFLTFNAIIMSHFMISRVMGDEPFLAWKITIDNLMFWLQIILRAFLYLEFGCCSIDKNQLEFFE